MFGIKGGDDTKTSTLRQYLLSFTLGLLNPCLISVSSVPSSVHLNTFGEGHPFSCFCISFYGSLSRKLKDRRKRLDKWLFYLVWQTRCKNRVFLIQNGKTERIFNNLNNNISKRKFYEVLLNVHTIIRTSKHRKLRL